MIDIRTEIGREIVITTTEKKQIHFRIDGILHQAATTRFRVHIISAASGAMSIDNLMGWLLVTELHPSALESMTAREARGTILTNSGTIIQPGCIGLLEAPPQVMRFVVAKAELRY